VDAVGREGTAFGEAGGAAVSLDMVLVGWGIGGISTLCRVGTLGRSLSCHHAISSQEL
jgi:hypothetical protein